MRSTLSILTTVGIALGAFGTAHASLIQDTDSYGIVWTLESDGANHGTAANPLYDVFLFADTAGFTASHGGTNFDAANAYINDVTILANANPTSGTVYGPGDMSNGALWMNVLGGQNSSGCNNTSNTNFDCAYSKAGGNPPTGPGVLMNSSESNLAMPLVSDANLEWEFELGFAQGTADPLSFSTNGSHLKVDYYGYQSGTYGFVGQISDDVTINDCSGSRCTPPPSVPEPGTLALFGAGLFGCAVFFSRRRSRQS